MRLAYLTFDKDIHMVTPSAIAPACTQKRQDSRLSKQTKPALSAGALDFPITNGFSLVEMLWVITVIGIVLAITDMSGITSLNNSYFITKQTANNKNIANALLQHAKTNTARGNLPAPYTGSSYNNTVFNPADSSPTGLLLTQTFRSANIAPADINTDGTSAKNVRVYQTVDLSQATPLDFQSGPLVTLSYQYAELHQTTCMLSNATCNKSSPNIPGASVQMTTANYKNWTTISPDLPAEFFSTLPMQKQMLALTSQRLNDLRDKFAAHFRTKQQAASADDTTNWFPYPYTIGLPSTPVPNYSGANAAGTGLGCQDGWYDLAETVAGRASILDQLGLSAIQYGTTAWGGQILYCRDYDPALRGPNSLPHYAALRINKSVSTAAPPDATLSNNIFITF